MKPIQYRPVAVYNTTKKELVGIFRYKCLVARYIYKLYNIDKQQNIENCLKKKGKIIKDLIFDFKIALRYATDLQIEMLGEKDFIILNNYYYPSKTRMAGFNYKKSNINNNH
jgi:hypothetical protein